MNENNEQLEDLQELPPLDDFEQQWVDQLANRETDLVQSEEAFVQRVMQAEAASAAGSPVLGRIGFARLLPYAAAAAILLAAFVGWYALQDNSSSAPEQPNFVNQPDNTPQPDNEPTVETPERPKVELGKLIAQATTTNPTADLTDTVGEMPETLSIDRLLELVGDSVPDLKELLAPLDQSDQQSRA